MGGRPQGSPLRKCYKGCDAERNPPVTASPCQPPLGKGALGTRGTDCHDQRAGWSRNDTSSRRNAVARVGGQGRSPLRIDWMPVRRSVVREDHAVGEGPGGGDDQIALAEDPLICGALGGADQAEAVAPVHQVYGLAVHIGAQAAEKLQ